MDDPFGKGLHGLGGSSHLTRPSNRIRTFDGPFDDEDLFSGPGGLPFGTSPSSDPFNLGGPSNRLSNFNNPLGISGPEVFGPPPSLGDFGAGVVNKSGFSRQKQKEGLADLGLPTGSDTTSDDDPFLGEARAKVPRIADMSHGVATGIPEPDKRFGELYKDQTREENNRLELQRLEAQRDQRQRELDDLRRQVEAERQAEAERQRNQQQRP
uniref:Clathrin light chain n=1 Tax=Steinernema glaseri TaxID=37863 RepID=A0A1I7ZSS7_9BILA